MPYFLANWSERPHAIFRMGLQQGLFCVGCCWAMMLLALVAGFMHPVWMAAVAALAVLEKVLPQPRSLVMGTGIGLIAAGTVLLSATGEGGYAIW
jgi:predicted metal-binding membrane protein